MHAGANTRREEINAGIRRFEETPGAYLLDVRDEDEYSSGHIPQSKNMPIAQFAQMVMMVPQSAPLFVYAATPERADIAVKRIRLMGYGDITDLGSIEGFEGALE